MSAARKPIKELLADLEAGVSAKDGKRAQYSGVNIRMAKRAGKPVPKQKRHPWKGAR